MTKVRAAQKRGWSGKAGGIRDVEYFRAKLESFLPAQSDVLEQRCIEMPGRRTIQLIASLVAKRAGRLRSESIYIEIPRDCGMREMRGTQLIGTIGGAGAGAGVAYITGV